MTEVTTEQHNLGALMQMADNLSAAHANEMKKVHTQEDRREAVLSQVEEEPERGSLAWWQRFCRTNTGSALCDSGTIYGYQWSSALSPFAAYVDLRERDYIDVTIDTPHFLETMLESDESMEALQEVWEWYDGWLNDDSYLTGLEEFAKFFNSVMWGYHGMYRGKIRGPGPNLVPYKNPRRRARGVIKRTVDELYDPPRYTWRPEPASAGEVVKDFPYHALAVLDEHEIHQLLPNGGCNTYNHESDLNQVVQWQEFGVDRSGDVYDTEIVAVQPHCGCDVRGGYPRPQFFRAPEIGYFYSWLVDFWCDCGSQWEMAYYYGQAIEKSGLDFKEEDAMLGADQMQQLQDWVDRTDDMLNEAQGRMAGDLAPSVQKTMALKLVIEEEEGHGKDREIIRRLQPVAVSLAQAREIVAAGTWVNEGWVRVYPECDVDYGERKVIDLAHAQFRCPDCGKWTVCASTMAYGY